MKAGVLPAAAMLAATVLPAAALECPAERAVYTHASEPAITAGFIPSRHFASMASDLYFRVSTMQRTYWFTMQTALGYGGASLTAVGDPYRPADGDPDNGPVQLGSPAGFQHAMGFHPLDSDLAIAGVPQRGEQAPPYIYTPDLGLVLWYAPRELTQDQSAQRDPMDRGAFKLTSCLERAAPPAYP